MICYQAPEPSPSIPCPYLPGQTLSYAHFFASEVREEELDRLLARGWRKFGAYFFRPDCPQCQACQPLRIPVHGFVPSQSQRRALKRARSITMTLEPLRYRPEFYEIYNRHSVARFGEETDVEEFLLHLHSPSCPAALALYRNHDRVVGVSYLDMGAHSISSVYFAFDPEFSHLSLGTVSILREILLTRHLGRQYYYLGFAVHGCSRMEYKTRFRPHELLCWETCTWQTPSPGPTPTPRRCYA
jgi:arginyl-tRNA--protein-N-Asp/Glu arginylyltransferase